MPEMPNRENHNSGLDTGARSITQRFMFQENELFRYDEVFSGQNQKCYKGKSA